MPWASRGGRATRLVIVIALATVALSGLVRLANLAVYPGLIYDEHFYVHDANSVLHGRVGPLQPLPWRPGDEIGLDHPPLGTLAIATGVAVMGNDPWGWRVPSAIAGTLLIALVYPLARRLCLPPRWALTALVLAAADPLLIVESRIGVLDPFVALWSAVCIYCALRFVQSGWPTRWLILTGLAGGLAVASKWSGALALATAAAIIGADYLRKHRTARSSDGMGQVHDGDVAGEGRHVAERGGRPAGAATRLAGVVACLILLPLLVYVASYAQYFARGHSVSQWLHLEAHMATYNWTVQGPQTFASRPFTWIFDAKPIWYEWSLRPRGVQGLVAVGNPLLFWISIAAFAGLLWLAVRRRDPSLAVTPLLVAILYLPWLATSRESYIYYLTPVVPFMAIMVAAFFARLSGPAAPSTRWTATLVATGALTAGLAAGGTPAVRLAALVVLAAVLALAGLARRHAGEEVPRAAALGVWLYTGAVVGVGVAWLPFVLSYAAPVGYYARMAWFAAWR